MGVGFGRVVLRLQLGLGGQQARPEHCAIVCMRVDRTPLSDGGAWLSHPGAGRQRRGGGAAAAAAVACGAAPQLACMRGAVHRHGGGYLGRDHGAAAQGGGRWATCTGGRTCRHRFTARRAFRRICVHCPCWERGSRPPICTSLLARLPARQPARRTLEAAVQDPGSTSIDH